MLRCAQHEREYYPRTLSFWGGAWRPTKSDFGTPVESIGLQKPENLLLIGEEQKKQIPRFALQKLGAELIWNQYLGRTRPASSFCPLWAAERLRMLGMTGRGDFDVWWPKAHVTLSMTGTPFCISLLD